MSRFTALTILGALFFGSSPQASAQPRCDAPRVLFAVDKSSSMLGDLPGGTTKWDAAVTALAEVTRTFEDRVEQGLQVFPYPDRCEPGRVELEVQSNSAMEMVRGLGGAPPEGGNFTPMAETLDLIADYAPMLDMDHQRHVVLITDGWQYCVPYDASTRFAPVESVAQLRELGMTVHVIGFGAGVDSLTLNRAAVAGGTALPGCDVTLTEPGAMGHCYQQANDIDELRTALEDVARLVTEEECDGFDNDCDGMVDEGFDVDGDMFTTCGSDPEMPGITDSGRRDCDDSDMSVFPGAEEICDGIDNNCDDDIDTGCECMDGESRNCGSEIGACVAGTQSCVMGAWGACEGGMMAADADRCDGTDEDCDGMVDEDAMCGPSAICVEGMCEATEPPDPGPGPEPEPEPEPEPTPTPEPDPRDPAMMSGCGCTTAGTGSNPAGALLGLGLCFVAVLRRRR